MSCKSSYTVSDMLPWNISGLWFRCHCHPTELSQKKRCVTWGKVIIFAWISTLVFVGNEADSLHYIYLLKSVAINMNYYFFNFYAHAIQSLMNWEITLIVVSVVCFGWGGERDQKNNACIVVLAVPLTTVTKWKKISTDWVPLLFLCKIGRVGQSSWEDNHFKTIVSFPCWQSRVEVTGTRHLHFAVCDVVVCRWCHHGFCTQAFRFWLCMKNKIKTQISQIIPNGILIYVT